MKKTILSLICALFVIACGNTEKIEVEPIPSCNFETERHSTYTYSCLSSRIPFIYEINNYSPDEIDRIAHSFQKAAEDHDLEFSYKDIKFILTDDAEFYNGRHWYFLPEADRPKVGSDKWNVFESTVAYYQWETSTIYVNVTKGEEVVPIYMLPHEYIHVTSHLNFDTLDEDHANDLLWVDLLNSFYDHWVADNYDL